jgi:hypothetical protein
MSTDGLYPIGTPGQPWAADERAQWLAMQRRQRSYADDVVRVIDTLRDRFDVVEYGGLDYGDQHFVLYALRSVDWDAALPIALVTGGVHGYETSGVHGARQSAGRALHQPVGIRAHPPLECAGRGPQPQLSRRQPGG